MEEHLATAADEGPAGATGAAAPTEPRRERRMGEIVDTAARLFATNGYAATGVAELCEAVSLGRGALYYYIGSKEGLLVRIHDRVIDLLLQRYHAIAAEGHAPEERLRRLGAAMIETITTYPDHCFVFMHEWRSLSGEAAERFRARRREVEQLVEGTLAEGVEQGVFRCAELRIATLAWLALHNYTYHWYRPGGRFDAATIAAAFHQIFCDGLRSGEAVDPAAAVARLASA